MAYISGIVSGIDTEQLIGQLMQIERRPIALMQQRVNVLAQRRDAYRDVNTRLGHLLNAANDLLRSATFNTKTATSSAKDVAALTATTSAVPATYTVSVTKLAQAHRIASDAQGASSLGLQGAVVINGVSIEIDADMTLNDVSRTINEAGAGVRASVLDHTLILESEATGVENAIHLVDGGGVLTALGLLDANDVVKHELQAAQDALLIVNGLSVTRGSNTIDDLAPDVTFRLLSTGDATLTVDRDLDATIAKIQAFVDQYNSVQQFIGGRVGENGALQGDGTLNRLRSSLRHQATDAVGSPGGLLFRSLGAIGIEVSKDGAMSVDTAKLREALKEHPDEVRRLFSASVETDGFDGAAARLAAFIRGYTATGTGILSSRDTMYREQMSALEASMKQFEARLAIRERSLVRQFTRMEEALNAMQSLSLALEGHLAQLYQWSSR